MTDEHELTDPFSRASEHVRSILGGIALVGTIIPFLFFAFNVLGLDLVGRIVSTFVLFTVIIGIGVASVIKGLNDERASLRAKLEEMQTDSNSTALSCLAFEILNGDNELAIDENHFYEKQERVYDISGEEAYFYNRYVGEVKPGKTSSGIVFKYIGDGRVDGADVPINITRNKPDIDESDAVEPEIITNDEDPYAVTFRLPFGRELSGGEEFDIEVECPEMGETQSNQRVRRVHFPLHRYERVDRFEGTIVISHGFDSYEAARVDLKRDEITRQRDILVEDFELHDIDMNDEVVGNKREWSFVEHKPAAKLYVFRFLMDMEETAPEEM